MNTHRSVPSALDRRRFLTLCSALGVSGTVLPEVLWAVAKEREIDDGVLASAAAVAGIELTPEERELMLKGVGKMRDDIVALRAVPLANEVPPALRFDPSWGAPEGPAEKSLELQPVIGVERPAAADDLSFLSVLELGGLIREGSVTSVELAEMALDRLRRYDPKLEAVITLTAERALQAAEAADREIAAGRWRGPLHGIPWGAKDLLAVAGYPTTWGAMPFKDQVFDHDAAVVTRLDEAGAVLVAKLTLGALAWGDVWYGGKTKNPWNLEQGSSGSSAGPAAAVAAGLVPFAIGSETWGSIVSPATRCGVTGLRPTFGRVSRHGAMALSWSMDKLGPMARTVSDCAAVFFAIMGADGADPTAIDRPFDLDLRRDPLSVRVGYVPALFEPEPAGESEEEEESERRKEWHANDLASLESLRGLGFELHPITLPDLPVSALSFILDAEAAAAFDELTRSGRDDLLVRQIEYAWPNSFRQARLIPAVEYIQANRVRTLLMAELERSLEGVDVYISPSYGGDNLLMTNLTGHPQVVLPNGFGSDGTPTSITFTGRLYGEAELLLVADALQRATDFHRRHPDLGG